MEISVRDVLRGFLVTPNSKLARIVFVISKALRNVIIKLDKYEFCFIVIVIDFNVLELLGIRPDHVENLQNYNLLIQ